MSVTYLDVLDDLNACAAGALPVVGELYKTASAGGIIVPGVSVVIAADADRQLRNYRWRVVPVGAVVSWQVDLEIATLNGGVQVWQSVGSHTELIPGAGISLWVGPQIAISARLNVVALTLGLGTSIGLLLTVT